MLTTKAVGMICRIMLSGRIRLRNCHASEVPHPTHLILNWTPQSRLRARRHRRCSRPWRSPPANGEERITEELIESVAIGRIIPIWSTPHPHAHDVHSGLIVVVPGRKAGGEHLFVGLEDPLRGKLVHGERAGDGVDSVQ